MPWSNLLNELERFIAPEGLQVDSTRGFNPGEPSKQMTRPVRARDRTPFGVPRPLLFGCFARSICRPPGMSKRQRVECLRARRFGTGVPGVETPGLEFGRFQDFVGINKSLLSTKPERDSGLWSKDAGENASRRDGAIVAWHEVPGTSPPKGAIP
jgi:hypothetical protein